jgi:hypothetical protein
MQYFIGLDWGGAAHAVCVIAADGHEVTRFVAAHTTEGLSELRRLARARVRVRWRAWDDGVA